MENKDEPYKPLRWPTINEFYSNRNRRRAEEALANKEYEIDDSALTQLVVPEKTPNDQVG